MSTPLVKPILLDETFERKMDAMASAVWREYGNGVSSLDNTELAAGTVVETVGTPTYVGDVSQYSSFGLTDTGWYIFARIAARYGTHVTAQTTVTGAAGSIATVGNDYVDVAVRFGVAAVSQKVVVNWGTYIETVVFKSTDLAVRNLDYRTTFYIYDISPFVTWSYALTTDVTFVKDKAYFSLVNEEYVKLAEADKFALTADATFADGKTYYTESNGVFTAATVTTGEAVTADTYYELIAVTADTYYNHSKLHFEGMTRNITYRLDDMVDCPIEIVLPVVPDDGYGAWYEIQMRYDGSYSITLLPADNTVKIGTATTQNQTAGINIVDLQYTDINGVQMWTLLNTHSNIPT